MSKKNCQTPPSNSVQKPLLQFLLAMGMGLLLVFGGGLIKQIAWEQPALAQYLRPEFVAEQVYIRLSYLPKENEYVNQETGQVDKDNTLISRLIRYHQDIVKRPTRFRLDWQLTLADYLGANQPIVEERYPGRNFLANNPMEGDLKAINALSRRQRKELVDVLVSIYDVDPSKPSTSNSKPSTPQSNPTTPTTPKKPSLSQPGDADLLAPSP